jgi:hypothetical protein
MNFGYLCTLLPEGVMWGDPITPEIMREVVNAVDRKARKECAWIADVWSRKGLEDLEIAAGIAREIRETME